MLRMTTSRVFAVPVMVLAIGVAPGCGKTGAGSEDSGSSSRLDLAVKLEEVSEGGCLNVEKLVRRLGRFPETVLMKEFTRDFDVESSSTSRTVELFLAKASFIFRYLQAGEFAAELADFRQSDCATVTEVDAFVAPTETPEDDPNSDPEEAGGGSDDPMPAEPDGGGNGPNPNPDVPGGTRFDITRDEGSGSDTGPEPFKIDGFSPEHVRFSRSDGYSYEFRWIDGGSIQVSFGYKAELFRCNREIKVPVVTTRVYRWAGERTNASVDEEISSHYLRKLVEATDSSVHFGFSSSSLSSGGDHTVTAEDLFKLSSAPADSSLYRCR